MRAIILLCILILITFVACDVQFKPEHRNARDMSEHPRFKIFLNRLYPNLKAGKRGNRIAGGNNAALGQFPYQALTFSLYMGNYFMCGGSFVRYNYVITAGHCLTGFIELEIDVFAGIVNRQALPEWGTVVTNLNHIHVHPNYNFYTNENDIGLIFLASAPSTLFNSPNIGPVALPSASHAGIDLNGRIATISGFGMTDDYTPTNLLHYTSVPVASNEHCYHFFHGEQPDSILCIDISEGRAACEGDAGGPVTVEINPNERVLVGILSFGSAGGCLYDIHYVTTRVTSFLDWIQSIVN